MIKKRDSYIYRKSESVNVFDMLLLNQIDLYQH